MFISRSKNASQVATKPPQKPRQPRVGPETALDLAKTNITQLERALERMGGMDGPAVQAAKMELEKAPWVEETYLNVEIEETQKFNARSQRRLKEMDQDRVVEEALLFEPPQNLKRMVEKQKRVL